MCTRTCETCRWHQTDFSVGAGWCENNDDTWTDEEVVKYYEDGEPGCPHWAEEEQEEW